KWGPAAPTTFYAGDQWSPAYSVCTHKSRKITQCLSNFNTSSFYVLQSAYQQGGGTFWNKQSVNNVGFLFSTMY
ncbi:MAG: hypothetical protein J6J43_02280, partial [Oscillospiraceae bacterium]|nr:hypothetical protein [Oscillospiraceae bacterium]